MRDCANKSLMHNNPPYFKVSTFKAIFGKPILQMKASIFHRVKAHTDRTRFGNATRIFNRIVKIYFMTLHQHKLVFMRGVVNLYTKY